MLGDVTVCLKKRNFVTVFCATITFLFKMSIFCEELGPRSRRINSENLSPEVIKLFFMLNSTEQGIYNQGLSIQNCDPSRKKVRVGWTTSFRENAS